MAEVAVINESTPDSSPKMCYLCMADLITLTPDPNAPTRECIRCKKYFCLNHISKIEPLACENCVRDVVITDTTFTRSETDWDEKSDRLITHTQKCRNVHLSGADWVWHQKRIGTLSDDELKSVIQYHKATVSMIESELTERTVKRNMRLTPIPGQSITTSRITESRTTRVTKPKTPDLGKLAEALKKLKLTPEELIKLIGGIA